MTAESLAYLACPYAHPNPFVMKKRHYIANKVTSQLISKGICVYSPLTHDIPLNELGIEGNWEFWKKHNHMMVSRCDKLILLKVSGWEQSKGVAGELECARKHNIPIEEMEAPEEKEIEQWMLLDKLKALSKKDQQILDLSSPLHLWIEIADHIEALFEQPDRHISQINQEVKDRIRSQLLRFSERLETE